MLVLVASFVAAHAQTAAEPPAQPQPCVPVIFDGREVSEICWSPVGMSLESRAATVSERLLGIARDVAAPPIRVHNRDGDVALMAGEQPVSLVFEQDARRAGVTKEQLAQQWATSYEQAVRAYRDARSTANIIRGILLALLIVAASLALLVAIAKAIRRAGTAACSQLERKLQTADARVIELLPNEVTRNLVLRALKLLRISASLVVIYFATQLLLGLFPSTRHLAQQMLTAVLAQVRGFIGAAWSAGPSLMFIALVALVTWYVIKFLRYLFRKIGNGAITIEGFRPSWAGTTQKLISFFVIVLAALIAYPYIPGSDSPAFKGISLFLGVLVSLGSTGLVANLVSGIILTYVDAFQIGDLVMIGEDCGYVLNKSVLTTQLRTRTNRLITLPNANVLAHRVVNLTSPDTQGLVVTSTVGIGYEAPWRQVETLLKAAALRTPGVRTSPEPFVLERALDQFSVAYELNAYLEPGVPIYLAEAALNRNILDAFSEAGIQIMTPSYQDDPKQPKIPPVADATMAQTANTPQDKTKRVPRPVG